MAMSPDEFYYRTRGMPDHRIKPPIELEWFGWRADTHTLARHGWEISESKWEDPRQDPWTREWQIHMRHKQAGVCAVPNDTVPFHMLFDGMRLGMQGERHKFHIHVHMAQNIHLQVMHMPEFMPVDARINYRQDDHMYRSRDVYDIMTAPYFQPIHADNSHDIWLREATMKEVLDVALSKQEPEQERIRKEMIKRQKLAEMKGGQEKARLILMA